MKKRNIIVCSILIIIIISIFTIIINSESKKTFIQDGVTYALNVDGVPTTSFPAKGMYRVDVTCENGTGKWDYDNWKLYIENITGNVSCDMEFTTVSKEYFNDYIIGLSGTTQGTGEVVYEDPITIVDYTDAPSLTESQYGSYSAYSASSLSATSGTAVSNVFTFDGTYWSTTASAMTRRVFYNFQFTAPEDGYYNFCYELSSTRGNVYVYVDGIRKINSSVGSICNDIGYVTSGSTIRVVQYSSSTTVTMIFNFQKIDSISILEAGYRYEGKNPNNYVWFNNELWRIIGVFDQNSHGVSDTNLVKIIRANPIGDLAWDKSNANDWTAASLMNLLNGAYYNQENGTNGDYCYGYSTTAKAHCDYTNIGISSTYRSMIKNVTWYLGPIGTSTESSYKAERENAARTTGNIGLMYASDYGYAALASSCARNTAFESYGQCTKVNWLYIGRSEWTISSLTVSTKSTASHVYYDGTIPLTSSSVYSVDNGLSVRPVLYLDSSVYVIDGSGTETDPYIIAD